MSNQRHSVRGGTTLGTIVIIKVLFITRGGGVCVRCVLGGEEGKEEVKAG